MTWETILATLTTLTALSTANDQIINLIRKRPYLIKLKIFSSTTPDAQKQDKKKVFIFSFTIGLCLITFTGLDMFYMLENSKINPGPRYHEISLNRLISILLTSYIISSGSKFIHELTDVVSHTKNLYRQKKIPTE